jgi:hypothetical protein
MSTFNEDAIADLVGKNYEVIIEQITKIKNQDRKVALLKLFTSLYLDASNQLSVKTEILKKVIELI